MRNFVKGTFSSYPGDFAQIRVSYSDIILRSIHSKRYVETIANGPTKGCMGVGMSVWGAGAFKARVFLYNA